MTTFLDILRAKATDLEAERNTQLTALETILNSQGERYAAATTDEARAAAMSFTPDEATAYTAARSRVDAISAELDGDGTDTNPGVRARLAELEEIQRGRTKATRTPVVPGMLDDPWTDTRDAKALPDADARGMGRAALERSSRFLKDEHRESVLELVDRGGKFGAAVARMALTTGNETYMRAWGKVMTGQGILLTEKEREFLARGVDHMTEQERATSAGMTSGTAGTGGYLVPVFIDPTMTITGAGTLSPMRQVATVKTIGPAFGGWYGATIAQVTGAWTAETVAAPDNTPTVVQPNIPVNMAELFMTVSYQAFDDISDLAADVAELFADGKNNLEAVAFVTGAGTTLPKGILTAISAVAGQRIASATSGVLVLADIDNLNNALAPRYRSLSSREFQMATRAVQNKVRALLRAENSANSSWTDMGRGVPPQYNGVDFFEASTMTSTLTTGNDVMLYADGSRYVIVDRVGFSTEFIPNLFDTSTGRPTAQRGWLARWRVGGDMIDTAAGYVLRLGKP